METKQLHDYDLEMDVLGGLMFNFSLYDKLPANMSDAIFFKPIHKTIAWAINDLKLKNELIDVRSVSMRLKAFNKLEEVGGYYYIQKLTTNALGEEHTINHFKILYQMYLLRNLVSIGHSLINKCTEYAADPFDITAEYERKINGILDGIISFDYDTIGEMNKVGIQRIKDVKAGKIAPGKYIGFESIQKPTGGWGNEDLIILAARPAMGKTSFALQAVLNPALDKKIPTAFFSLEMGKEPITIRAQSVLSGYNSTNIRLATSLTDDDVRSIELSTSCLTDLPVYFDETPALSLFDFKNKARKFVKELGVQLIVIDYLQLMTINGTKKQNGQSNREQEISTISRGLKAIAKELKVPILALSQLSRKVDERADKRPMLSDLRESGAIEQDADMIIFIMRPEYYGIKEMEDGSSSNGMAEIIIAKNRNGGLGIENFEFVAHNTKFVDPANKLLIQQPQRPLSPNTSFETEINEPF